MINPAELHRMLIERRKNEIVVYTMSAQREWHRYSTSPLDFFVSSAMGYASSLGLGLALAQPERRVWVLDGDGSLLMNLGTLVTIADQSPPNLVYFLLGNGLYDIPGQIRLVGQGKVDFPSLARSAGLKKVYDYDELDGLKERLSSLGDEAGPVFIYLKVTPGPRGTLDWRGRGGTVAMARAMEKALSESKG
ncbi:MAG: thiamine pyrophosphate-binding protein [Chloroflexi bacterium]|nr:thiamine pyrophosphate-binding protein [Chloroflexota bacterium]